MKRYLLLILATASCMAPDRTRATLRKAGFEDVRVTGYEPLACGKDDWYSTGFSGKNSTCPVDDLCRAPDPGGFLDELDEIRSSCLVIATANRIDRMDPAALRRFDDSYLVSGIDPEVFDKLCEGLDTKVVERLRGLPVDWVAKYRELHEVLGPEKAREELEGILNRRKEVRHAMEN